MAEVFDVIICGSGSAGLSAATWLSQYPGVRVKILERRGGPLVMGQADGVQCRTVEMFESFGLAEELLRESYHVLELAFWAADDQDEGQLKRTSRAGDTPSGLSHQPHVILNQARMNAMLIERMRRWSGLGVDYGWDVKGVRTLEGEEYAVEVRAEKDGKEEVFRAKYALGCDGAHSSVRRSLGYKMVGDSTDAVWGVMDVYPQTDFPDIRRKCTIHSEAGLLMIIPREGGSLARFYLQMPAGVNPKELTLADLQSTARKIFSQYRMDFAETAWWSAYAIGQRLADHFTKDDVVFLTGDACHTHSPKAGQGMNVSLQDGYNIGWKLGSILTGQARPDLITTYTTERGKVAADLIDFDRNWTKMFDAGKDGSITPQQFTARFLEAARYTAGLTNRYEDSVIMRAVCSAQALATNLVVGMRFPSRQVVRFCDAKGMHLIKALKADGRWRVVIFAGDITRPEKREKLDKLAAYLDSPSGPVRLHTPPEADVDSFIEPLVVLAGKRIDIEQEQIPPYFWPVTGKWGMRDLHKVFVDDEGYNSPSGRAYEFYGVDPEVGAVVVVRPDQYVSQVTSLDDYQAIGDFFAGFALARGRTANATS